MARSFTLIQLRYFMEIARLENMRAAAQELNVTQSTLSASLSQLEHDLGVQLFQRLPNRALRITQDGKRMASGARLLLEDADSLSLSISGESQSLSGVLRVGLFAPLAAFIAPKLLKEFSTKYPNMTVNFIEGDQSQILQALRNGECEIAMMYDLGVGAEFAMEPVERLGAHVIVSQDHWLAKQELPVQLAQLVDEPLVLLDQEHSREYFLRLFSVLNLEPKIGYWVSGYETVRSYVAMGLGYSILNRRLPHDQTYTGKTVVPIIIADPVLPITVVVVYPKDLPVSRKARVFATFAGGSDG
ncbi:LysR family transcriptional regulator [Arthrobacter sp. MYb213]|uniref:LysR family transcriptional regulator n=1 Tax=Arthrobacter sp. MYb213 TaxID=1848595 RepID=UPI000CFBD9F1|nr:LysR family transcriptional regulator [Arthrobacter sp. MYb213]PRB71710.1 LysR family transcriptional regulator [Arthrobacter sp. MYb213]